MEEPFRDPETLRLSDPGHWSEPEIESPLWVRDNLVVTCVVEDFPDQSPEADECEDEGMETFSIHVS